MNSDTFNPDTAERTIIDRAEFARLIRKHRGLGVFVTISDYCADKVVRGCQPGHFGVTVPAKQAIEKLESGDFDAFVWEANEYGAHVVTYSAAPAWLQITRRRELRSARIESHIARLARPVVVGDSWDARMRESAETYLAKDRAEVARWDAELAAIRAPKPAEIAA